MYNPMIPKTTNYSDEIIKEGDDRVYYNIDIREGRLAPTGLPYAEFNIERSIPIIENPSDYYLTITRFQVPVLDTPIMIMPISNQYYDSRDGKSPPLPPPVVPPAINWTPFTVTLSYLGVDFHQSVVHVTDTPLAPVPTVPGQVNVYQPYYYAIYTYTQFLDMVNTAMAKAFADLDAYFGSAQPQTEPPYYLYDEETQLISLVVQYSYLSSAVNPLDIYINAELLTYIENIRGLFYQRGAVNGKDFQYIIQDRDSGYAKPGDTMKFFVIDSSNDGYEINDVPGTFTHGRYNNATDLCTQLTADLGGAPWSVTVGINNRITIANTTPTVFKWEPIETASILGFSNPTYSGLASYTGELIPMNMPIYLRFPQDYKSLDMINSFQDLVFTTGTLSIAREWTQTSDPLNLTPNAISLLTDFQPLLNQAGDSRQTIAYYPQGGYRIINLLSKTPLRNFDFKLWWKDKVGRLYPLTIPFNQTVSIKFLFLKKATFTS